MDNWCPVNQGFMATAGQILHRHHARAETRVAALYIMLLSQISRTLDISRQKRVNNKRSVWFMYSKEKLEGTAITLSLEFVVKGEKSFQK